MMSSAGCDGIAAEMIKYAPETIEKKIVNIFNNIAETADIPGQLDKVYLNHSRNLER